MKWGSLSISRKIAVTMSAVILVILRYPLCPNRPFVNCIGFFGADRQ